MTSPRVAFFVSSHGFGHAARACGLIEELQLRTKGNLAIEIHSGAPEWFFRESLGRLHFDLFAEAVDAGLVQRNAMEVDTGASMATIADTYPLDTKRVERTARGLRERRVGLMVADIAPLGIAAARQAGIPAALVENFTWDWIYARLDLPRRPLAPLLQTLREQFDAVDLRIQTEPAVAPVPGAAKVGAIARRPRTGREVTRERLGIGPREAMVLLSMGGVPWSYSGAGRAFPAGVRPVVVGEGEPDTGTQVIRLAHHSAHHHPDLVAAADVVVGKLGYSTVAEVWQAGGRLVWVDRPDWPEQEALAAHVESVLPSRRIDAPGIASGAWLSAALELLEGSDPGSPYRDGRPRAAELLLTRLAGEGIP